MPYIVKLTSGVTSLLVLTLALTGCDSPDPTGPATSIDPASLSTPSPSFASSFRGGIPFGVFHLPKEEYGTAYNGSLATISPSQLLSYLETARRSGTRIMLSFSGGYNNYRNSDLSFSLTKWKERIDRYRGIDFSSYIADGTILGHYLVDEPNDETNWGGTTIAPATVEEMARYSKQLWPAIPTIVRVSPAYLKGSKYNYLDGAWAQYHQRFGSVESWISKHVADAKASGLALVAGLNQLAGGTTTRGLKGYYGDFYAMSAGELESWGGALLNVPEVCAFLSWRHDPEYMGRSDIKAAMDKLSARARSHTPRSCRGTNGQTSGTEPEPPAVEGPATSTTPEAPTTIVLKVTGQLLDGRHVMRLTWSGASGSTVDLYRGGVLIRNTTNDQRATNTLRYKGAASYVYKVCETGSSRCSNEVRIDLR